MKRAKRSYKRITKNFYPEYSRRGTRAKGKIYGLPMHNLKPLDDDRTVAL